MSDFDLDQRIAILFSLTSEIIRITDEVWDKSRRLNTPNNRGHIILNKKEEAFLNYYMRFSSKDEIFNDITKNVLNNGITFYKRK